MEKIESVVRCSNDYIDCNADVVMTNDRIKVESSLSASADVFDRERLYKQKNDEMNITFKEPCRGCWCCHILSNIFSFYTFLFVCSVICGYFLIKEPKNNSDFFSEQKIGLIILALAFLISSVIVKLKTDSCGWLKRCFKKKVMDAILSDGLDKEKKNFVLELLELK